MTRTPVEPPYLVALNLTRRCNLNCAHCYLDAGTRASGTEDELTTAEVEDLLDGIASLSDETMVVFTGGEPMLRPDLERLIRHASDLGLMAVIGTNGTLLNTSRVEKLIKAGAKGAGISLDSLDPAYHDSFRGKSGSWTRTMASLDACKQGGLAFQIHFSVTDDNAHELDDMIDFARSAGALVLNVFFLICTGRGETLSNISAETYDRVLRRLTEAAHKEDSLLIRAKCAPHFKRLAVELDSDWPVTLAHGYEAGGCLAGSRYCRVTPTGEVTPCPYIEQSAGSVRRTSFGDVWRHAPLFQTLRAPSLEGRCGACEYTKLCGGCRARPFARSGNLMGEDFLCDYQPRGGAVIEPFNGRDLQVVWSPEAEQRLARVPSFVRRMVRQRAEQHVRRKSRREVLAQDLTDLMRARFGDRGLPFAAPPPAAGRETISRGDEP